MQVRSLTRVTLRASCESDQSRQPPVGVLCLDIVDAAWPFAWQAACSKQARTFHLVESRGAPFNANKKHVLKSDLE